MLMYRGSAERLKYFIRKMIGVCVLTTQIGHRRPVLIEWYCPLTKNGFLASVSERQVEIA